MLTSEVIFPTSPNWYLAHTVDATSGGTIALATNQSVTVIDATTRQVIALLNLRGRVTGVALAEGLLCACLLDRTVQAFALPKLSLIGTHKDHHGEPSAIAATGSLCITGDRRGTLCTWSLPGGKLGGFQRLSLQRESIVSLAISQPGRAAVGCAGGCVSVVDLSAQAVLHTLQHSSVVQSLSWANHTHLATACQDQSVQIWRLLGESGEAKLQEQICECVGRSDSPEGRVWLAVIALSESSVAYSGQRGELNFWEAAKRKPQRSAPVHARPIFGIRRVGSEHIVTTSMDRLVVLWSWGKNGLQMKWRLATLGGHVTTVRTDGANVMFMGCGDNSARVVDLMHREHRQHCWVVWKGLRSPVMSAQANPSRSFWAYGLQDGSFGIFPMSSSEGPGRVEALSSKSHRGPVSSLSWLRLPGGGAEEAQAADPPQAAPESGPRDDGEGGVGDNAPDHSVEGQKLEVARGSEGVSAAGSRGRGGGGKKPSMEETRTQIPKAMKGMALVTVCAGHEICLSSSASSPGGAVKTSPLALQAISGSPASPLVSAACPHPELPGDLLVVAATHAARDDLLEVNSLQLFHQAQAEEGAAEDGSWQCVAALPAEGLEGGATCMALRPVPGSEEPACQALCGTSKGGLSVVRLRCGQAAALRGLPVWSSEAQLRQVHTKVVDVQWREAGTDDHALLQLLTAGQDGVLKVWSFAGKPPVLRCLHTLPSLVQASAGGGLITACWDMSSGGGDLAVLAGGREQVAFRWTPGKAHSVPSAEAGEVAVSVPTPVGLDEKSSDRDTATIPVVQAKAPAVPAPRHAKQKAKPPASLLNLASAAVYQQSSKSRALELVRLRPESLELWPGVDPVEAPQVDSQPKTVASAIFVNSQRFADSWLEMEFQHKLQGSSEDRSVALQRARFLKFWAADVGEVLAASLREEQGCAGGASDAGGVSPVFLWAALSPSSGLAAWEGAISRLLADAKRAGSSAESVHHAVAAALALDRLSEAVQLYLKAELFMDALLLSRLRLPSRHPIVARIYEQWASDLKKRGRHDQAAACRLALGGQLGKALADLEDWFSPPRPQRLGPDPVRLAVSFAAASIAEAIATAFLKSEASGRDGGDSSDDDEHAEIAYDHRTWWGKPELRTAVLAWRRCIGEAVQASRYEHALKLARVVVETREVSRGEDFLRSTLAGYASAIAWMLELERVVQESEAEKVPAHVTPLQQLLDSGGEAVAPDGDWDFEWRALTWLPGFDPQDDVALTAAVELGRGCASLASGSTRGAAAQDAPWDHVANAVNAILGAGEAAVTYAPLKGLGALARRPSNAPASRSLGECVASTAWLAAQGQKADRVCLLCPWQTLSAVLVGLPATRASASHHRAAADAFRRGHRLAAAALGVPDPASQAMAQASAAALCNSSVLGSDLSSCCKELETAVRDAVLTSGLELSCGSPSEAACTADASSSAADSSPPVEIRLAEALQGLQGTCASALLVPLAVVAWCQGLVAKAMISQSVQVAADTEGGSPEYEVADVDIQVQPEPRSSAAAWAAVLQMVCNFVSEAEADVDADTAWEAPGGQCGPELPTREEEDEAEAEAIKGVLKLESKEHLTWRKRLRLLCGGFKVDAGQATSAEVQQAGYVVRLLSTLSGAHKTGARGNLSL